MPTRIGTAARTLFVAVMYAVLYAVMQYAAAVLVGLSSGSVEKFGDTVTENLFICTLAAIAAASVLYIALGLLRERPVSDDIRFSGLSERTAVSAIIAALGCRIAVSVYTVFAEKIPLLNDSLDSAPDTSTALDSPFKVVFGLFVMMIAAPVFEEILFRGFIQTELMRGLPAPAAIIVGAVIFAVAHGILFQAVFTFFVGLVMGFSYFRTGSLFSSIIIHIIFNFTSAAQFVFYLLPYPLLALCFLLSLALIYISLMRLEKQ